MRNDVEQPVRLFLVWQMASIGNRRNLTYMFSMGKSGGVAAKGDQEWLPEGRRPCAHQSGAAAQPIVTLLEGRRPCAHQSGAAAQPIVTLNMYNLTGCATGLFLTRQIAFIGNKRNLTGCATVLSSVASRRVISISVWLCVGAILFLLSIPLLAMTGHAGAPDLPQFSPGDRGKITVRWVVEDGYYLNPEAPSSIAFSPPPGIKVSPDALETAGKVTGELEQSATIIVDKDARPGRYEVKVAGVLYFCSVREKWCKRTTRSLIAKLAVNRGASAGNKNIDIELVVPLPEEQ